MMTAAAHVRPHQSNPRSSLSGSSARTGVRCSSAPFLSPPSCPTLKAFRASRGPASCHKRASTSQLNSLFCCFIFCFLLSGRFPFS